MPFQGCIDGYEIAKTPVDVGQTICTPRIFCVDDATVIRSLPLLTKSPVTPPTPVTLFAKIIAARPENGKLRPRLGLGPTDAGREAWNRVSSAR